jgi:hypothetical protein
VGESFPLSLSENQFRRQHRAVASTFETEDKFSKDGKKKVNYYFAK